MMDDRKFKRKKSVPNKNLTDMLSVQKIAEIYGFHPHTVRAWVKHDELYHTRHGKGGKIFIKRSDLERFLMTWYEFKQEDLDNIERGKR